MKMVNNIIKFKEIQQFYSERPEVEERIQILTITMDDFKVDPFNSGMAAFEFIVGDESTEEAKVDVASHFRNSYVMKKAIGNSHISSEEDQYQIHLLTSWLRKHPFWGRILGNME